MLSKKDAYTEKNSLMTLLYVFRSIVQNIDSLTCLVVECVAEANLKYEDREMARKLISELLGERKNLYWGLSSGSITSNEAASAIMSHLYTEYNGYFRSKSLVNFDALDQLAQIFRETI